MRVPYPRTPHLPWSRGASSDDVRAGDLSGLRGVEVVVEVSAQLGALGRTGDASLRGEHPVPPEVLAAQLRRFVPPYPGQAHRTWYVGAGGTVDDTDGTLDGAPEGQEW